MVNKIFIKILFFLNVYFLLNFNSIAHEMGNFEKHEKKYLLPLSMNMLII